MNIKMFYQFFKLIQQSLLNNKFHMILTCFPHLTDSEIDVNFGLISYPCTPLNNLLNKYTRQIASK